MSRLTRFTREVVQQQEIRRTTCALDQDAHLAERQLNALIGIIDEYCSIYNGACKAKDCPIWDIPKEIECLD